MRERERERERVSLGPKAFNQWLICYHLANPLSLARLLLPRRGIEESGLLHLRI
jgi:hypothetical protein